MSAVSLTKQNIATMTNHFISLRQRPIHRYKDKTYISEIRLMLIFSFDRHHLIKAQASMNKQIVRIIGRATTVAANAMRIRMNRPFVLPRSDLSYTENMLYMMDHMNESTNYRPDPRIAKALDILFVLHADVSLAFDIM